MDVIIAIGRDTFAVFATVVVLFLSFPTLFLSLCRCAPNRCGLSFFFAQPFETMARLYVFIKYHKATKILGSLKPALLCIVIYFGCALDIICR